MSDLTLTRRSVLARAWPLVFANATVPIAGVVDTFVLGRTGSAADLAGVAQGAILLSVLHGSTYFLRMGTTALTAQAEGADNAPESQRTLLRALGLALILGVILLLARDLVAWAGFAILPGEADTEAVGSSYFLIRMFGLTGGMIALAISGWLIGQGRSLDTLAIFAVFSLVNIGLDLWFVFGLGWGPDGVALATVIAEWAGAGLAIIVALNVIRKRGGWADGVLDRSRLLDPIAVRRLVLMNTNLMIRTWTLTIGFFWFVHSGTQQGTAELAGNHVLLQIITLWAFVLDAFAFVAEAESGRAIGKRSVRDLRRAARLAGEAMAISGAVFAALTLFAGTVVLGFVVEADAVRASAVAFLPYCAAVPFIGAAAWLLDGMFIGAAAGPTVRNAGIASLSVYLAVDFALGGAGNHGVWAAFLVFYLARAAALALAWPSLERRAAAG